MPNQTYQIIYPSKRIVSAEQLILWACDDISNGLTDADKPTNVAEAIAILHDTGTVTVKAEN